MDIETYKKESFETDQQAGLDPKKSLIRTVQIFDGNTVFIFDIKKLNSLAVLDSLAVHPMLAHNAMFEMKHLLHHGLLYRWSNSTEWGWGEGEKWRMHPMIRECGAKARTNHHKPCRQPAMTNGRCRLHGGLSTGPKTIEGRQRARLAVLKHGFYTQTALEDRRRLRSIIQSQKEHLKFI